jgi:hypothetical protein
MYWVDVTGALALAVVGAVVVVGIWWAYKVSQGVRFRPILLGVLSVAYILFFLAVETGNWLGIADVAPIDLSLLAIALVVSYFVTLETTRILYNHRGETGYRGNPVLVVVWLVLLLLEIYVQQVILGRVTIFHLIVVRGLPAPVDPGSVAHPYRVVLATVDALFALSTGVTLGGNAALYTLYSRSRWNHARRDRR